MCPERRNLLSLFMIFFSFAVADNSIRFKDVALVSPFLGNRCGTEERGTRTTCEVKRGEEATFQANLTIEGGGVNSLSLTVSWTDAQDSLTEEQTCLDQDHRVRVSGDCEEIAMAGGSYKLQPLLITVPHPPKPERTQMSIYGDAVWSDGAVTSDCLLAKLEILLD